MPPAGQSITQAVLVLWRWIAGGAGLILLLGLAGWRVRRHRIAIHPSMPVPPTPPARDVADKVPPKAEKPTAPPAASAPARAVSDPFDLQIGGARIMFGEAEMVVDLQLRITNAQPGAAEGIRPALALISANPDQDRWRAAFHAAPPFESGVQPFDLAPGAGALLPVRLALRREQIHIVPLAGRPMFVAMLMIDLRWRGGLSIRHCGADFLLGAAGQGARPGPIWLDRPAPPALAAARYIAASSPAPAA